MSFLYTSTVRTVKHVVKVTDGCPQGLSTAVPWAWKVRLQAPAGLLPLLYGDLHAQVPSLTHVYGILSFSIPSPHCFFSSTPSLALQQDIICLFSFSHIGI